MKSEFGGTILEVRKLEDCIRATRKYTKGAFSRHTPQPVQGAGEFPSKVVTEYYEVYPEMDIGWDMAASDAWAWVWGDLTHIDIRFNYDYRNNHARIIIYGGSRVIEELNRGIPGFADTFRNINHKENGIGRVSTEEPRPAVGDITGGRVGTVPHPQ